MDPTFISYFHPRTLTVFILFLANSTLQLSVISCNLFLASLVQKFVFDSNIQSPSKIVFVIRQQNFLLKNFKNSYVLLSFSAFHLGVVHKLLTLTKFWGIFYHLLRCVDIFYLINIEKNLTFLDYLLTYPPLTPYVVHSVARWDKSLVVKALNTKGQCFLIDLVRKR